MELETVVQVRASTNIFKGLRSRLGHRRRVLLDQGYTREQVKRLTDPLYTFALEILDDLREAKRKGIWPAR